jgi:hypothetical protein
VDRWSTASLIPRISSMNLPNRSVWWSITLATLSAPSRTAVVHAAISVVGVDVTTMPTCEQWLFRCEHCLHTSSAFSPKQGTQCVSSRRHWSQGTLRKTQLSNQTPACFQIWKWTKLRTEMKMPPPRSMMSLATRSTGPPTRPPPVCAAADGRVCALRLPCVLEPLPPPVHGPPLPLCVSLLRAVTLAPAPVPPASPCGPWSRQSVV